MRVLALLTGGVVVTAIMLVGWARSPSSGLIGIHILQDVAAALTVGLLVLAVGILPPDADASADDVGHTRGRVVTAAALCAGVWAVASAAVTGIAYLSAADSALAGQGGLLTFLSQPALGGRLLLTTVLAAAVSVVSAAARRMSAAACALVVAVVALLSALARVHGAEAITPATTVHAVQVVALSAWLGSLAGLLLARRRLGDRLLLVLSRYSTLAAWCFTAVLASGAAAALLRIDSWASGAANGMLVLVASTAVVLLGIAEWWHRSRLLARARTSGAQVRFAPLAGAELIVLVLAVGLAVWLDRIPIPSRGAVPLVQLLPAPDVLSALTQWKPSLGWLAVAAIAAGSYLVLVVRLRRSSQHWPMRRTLSWVAGLLVVVLATSGAPAVYSGVTVAMQVLVSVLLAAVAPPFLVLARPLLLAESSLPARIDGSRGVREWLLHLRTAGPARLLRPFWVASAVYAAVLTLVIVGVAEGPLSALFVLGAGCLFAARLRAALSDAGSPRWRRVAVVLGAVSVQGALGIALLAGLVTAGGALTRIEAEWAPDRQTDRRMASQLVWAVGGGAVLLFALAVHGAKVIPAEQASLRGGGAARTRGEESLPLRPTGVTRRDVLIASAGSAAAVVTAGAVLAAGSGAAATAPRVAPVSALVERVESARRGRGTGRTVARQLTARPVELDLGGRIVRTWGYGSTEPLRCTAGDQLSIDLVNELPESTTIHWHGLRIRNDMDGVPYLTQDAVLPGERRRYEFTVPDPGTYWYHPHVGTQRERALFAPLIVDDPRERGDYDTEFVVVVDDWLDGVADGPAEVLRRLKAGGMAATYSVPTLDGAIRADWQRWEYEVPPNLATPPPGVTPDPASVRLAGEVRYPFHLLNGRLPSAPAVFTARPGQRARVRLINAAGTSTYRVALGGHRLTVTHSDGWPVEPVTVDTLQIAPGERYDVSVQLGDGVFPLVAVAEGQNAQAIGLVRTAGGGAPPTDVQPVELAGRLLRIGDLRAPSDDRLVPTRPAVEHPVYLNGSMLSFSWHINSKRYNPRHPFRDITPLLVRSGERVRLNLINQTPMYHPMHLHGHSFQVRAIRSIGDGGGQALDAGPRKDTLLVPPGQIMDVDLVADNPGQWLFHCHNSVHMATGMATVLSYTSSPE